LVPETDGVGWSLEGSWGYGGPMEVELRGGRGGEAVAVAPPAAGGGGRQSGRRWMWG
jgi:hypothetical protein